MSDEEKKMILQFFKPPFQVSKAGVVLDADGLIVLEMRGWGKIEKVVGSKEAIRIQDNMEKIFSDFLNKELINY